MSETTVPKGLGSINFWRDLLKGIYYAAIGQILYLIAFFINSLLVEHPRLPTWPEWLPYIKAVTVSVGGYIIGKFGVNNAGQILTKDQQMVRVRKDTLQELKDKASDNQENQ